MGSASQGGEAWSAIPAGLVAGLHCTGKAMARQGEGGACPPLASIGTALLESL